MEENGKVQQRLVQASAAKLREIVLARDAGAQIGSLREVAQLLGVGIVTVQQAARILEHEGLLVVKRGPGGGYYGARPDEAALERSMAAYLRVHGSGYPEALEMNTLLECELIAGAACCRDDQLREAVRALVSRVDGCDTPEERIALEEELHGLLFRMVDRPLIELLARVTMRHYQSQPIPPLFPGDEGVTAWKVGRHRILRAILEQDEELARFEANRNRQDMLARLRALPRGAWPSG